LQTNRLFILLEKAETEIRFALANGIFKMKMDIDRHGPRPMPNSCKNLNPPNFLLPTIFKIPQEHWAYTGHFLIGFVTHLGIFTGLTPLPISPQSIVTGLSVPGVPGGILVTGGYYRNDIATATTSVSL
jgi:hypothetical protein